MREMIKSHFAGHWQDFYSKYLPSLKHLSGEEYQAVCCFHDDKNPSLNVNAQTGQYFCHGCGKKGDAFHFYGKVNGYQTKADFAKILNGIGRDFGISGNGDGKQKARLVKTYDYRDATGKLVFQVCRFEPKDFRQRQPNGNKWTWNLKGVSLVPYNLPEVVKSDIVCICEGEKDVETLRGLGVVASTSPMGAKKWRPEYSEHFKGKHVILLPDNDQEGKDHMMQVGQALNGHAASLRLVELPGVPAKGDVTDFISKAGKNAYDALWALIDATPEYKPPKKASLDDAIMTARDFLNLDLPEKRTFIHPWLCEQSITLVSGWRGVGKSWFALELLRGIAKGESFGPWDAAEPVPVLYCDAEMVPQDVIERLNSLDADLGKNLPFYIYSDAHCNALGLPRVNLLAESWRANITRILKTRNIKVWVLDNLVSACPGIDENSQREWSPVNEWLLTLRFQGITTIMLHHTGKGGTQRGTSSREDNIDCSVILKRPHDFTPEDGCRFICHFEKARVRTADLSLLADTEFKLTHDDAGHTVWTYGNVKKETRREILRLLDKGLTQKDIAETLGVDKGYISRTRKTAIKDKHLTPENKLTQGGYLVVHGDEF